MLYRLQRRRNTTEQWAPASASVRQDGLFALQQAMNIARFMHPEFEYRLEVIKEPLSTVAECADSAHRDLVHP